MPKLTLDSTLNSLIFAVVLIAMLGTIGCGSTRQSTGSPTTTSSGASTMPPTAVAELSASNSSLSFGDVQMGTSTTQPTTLTNTGNSNLSISTISASGYGFTTSGGSNMTLAPNQSVSVYVNFSPTATGSASGTVSIASNAMISLLPISISGVGVTSQETMHSVALSWTPSSSNVVGYFIERSNVTGGPYTKLNATPDSNLSYADTALASGIYFYVVTSVGSNDVESGPSNEAQAVIL